MDKVVCIGTFDIVHEGHRNYFEQAKKLGEVIVIVAHDDNVKKDKGKTPKPQAERIAQVAKEPTVSKAIAGNKEDKYKIIEQIKPDIILLGYDSPIKEEKLQEELTKRGLKIRILRAKAHKPEIYKTTLIQQ